MIRGTQSGVGSNLTRGSSGPPYGGHFNTSNARTNHTARLHRRLNQRAVEKRANSPHPSLYAGFSGSAEGCLHVRAFHQSGCSMMKVSLPPGDGGGLVRWHQSDFNLSVGTLSRIRETATGLRRIKASNRGRV